MTTQEIIDVLKQLIEHERLHLCNLEIHPSYGAYISPDSRLADPSHVASSRFVFSAGLLLLAQQKKLTPTEFDSDLYKQVCLAAKFVLSSQRPSGLIDLYSTNYNSSPDTAFILQQFAALLELAQNNNHFTELNEMLERFIRSAFAGVREGGFHTPNHRWVICSALVQCKHLFADLEVQPVLDLYLQEGFDVDEDGAYLERSSGVYDTVTNNSLLLFSLHTDNTERKQAAQEAVRKNLFWNRSLHHTDGSNEANLSRRQDYGIRQLALNLVPAYVFGYFVLGEEPFLETAAWIWQKRNVQAEFTPWLVYLVLRFGDIPNIAAKTPENINRFYAINKLWRNRQNDLSVSAYGGQTHLLNFVYGNAELSNLKIAQTYFNAGMFIADSMEVNDKQVVLESSGEQKPRLPGYDLPLGQEVKPENWLELGKTRKYRPIPPAKSRLTLHLEDTTLQLYYQTLDGLDKVAAQISLDFPAGGIWESEDALFMPLSGQTILHKRGKARMIYGHDVIELSCGHFQQGYLAMRNSELQKPLQVRVLLTFLTPVDFGFSLKCYQSVFNQSFPFSHESS